MNAVYDQFRALHYQNEPLLLGNAWNVQSALVFEQLGYKAIGTSSAAIAHSLGYQDGEQMPFEAYLFLIKRITQSVTLPLTVDMEAGYGNSINQIVSNLNQLHALGVAGINIEDSLVTNSTRTLQPPLYFAEKLGQLTKALKEENRQLFINVRCDAFLLDTPDALNEARYRIEQYEAAGIDGIFLPGIVNENDIKQVIAATSLPLNVMCMPQLPSFEKLKALGVKRISMGNFVQEAMYQHMKNITHQITNKQSFQPLFN